MDNGTFVDNMLNDINRKYMDDEKNIQECLDVLRDSYTISIPFLLSRYPKRLKKQIDLRVKDMYYVMDPMWFVVALHHRNKSGLWKDMHKYGVKVNNVSSYKIEKASSIN